MSQTRSVVNIFAYGSNLHVNRIRQRAPTARPIAIGYVLGRRIEFRKRGLDGSAKADAMYTACPSDRVWGVVYSISSTDKVSLDKHESLGVGYDEESVKINCSTSKIVEALTYVARHEAIDESLSPYSWYVDFIKHGALQHSLPFCYINRELAVESVNDPMNERQHLNRLILNKSNG